MLTIKQFQERNNLGCTSVYSELKSGRLKAVKFGRATRITEEAEAKWLAHLPAYTGGFRPAKATPLQPDAP